MGSVPAQFEFAAEFAIFLVAAAGVALVLLRAELLSRSPWARACLGLGFAALATAAFLGGSLLIQPSTSSTVAGLRGAGLVLILIGSIRWRAGDVSQALVWLGVGLVGAAIVLRGSSGQVSDSLLAAGALSMGIALFAASRQAIAARVAATAAATLLVLVFILSLALSQVVSSTVHDDAIRRLDGRASSGATQTSSSPEQLRGEAVLVGTSVRASINSRPDCVQPDQSVVPSCVRDALAAISASAVPAGVELAWVIPGSGVVASSANLGAVLGAGEAGALPSSPAVAQAILAQQSTGTAAIGGGRAVAVGAYPDVVIARGPGLPGTARVMGVAVAVRALDRGYLEQLRVDDPTLSLALVGPTSVLSSAGGWSPAFSAVQGIASQVLSGGAPVTSATVQSRFIAGQAVVASNNKPVMAFLSSTPTTVVDQTQNDLYRTLFIIALGGTLLALLLASLVGDRVGSDLRRLTMAAESIRRGDADVRASVTSEDEVGRLGAAFNSMAASIEDKASALQTAAQDESRLRGRLEAVVGGMGEALVAVDSAGRITDFNHAAEELVLVSDSAARGRPVEEVITLVGEDGADLTAHLRRPPAQRWSTQCWLQLGDTALVPVAVSAGALRGHYPRDAGAVFVLRDLRREHEVERMKTEFLSRVGHELRTPLTGIMGFSDLMARKNVPPSQARVWHGEILEQSKRLLRVVERLEFFASAGAGRLRLRPDWVDVRTLVDEVVSVWETRLQAPWLISRRVERDLDPVVADRRWIRLAIDELVDNAVKFSPEGGEIVVMARAVRGGRVLEVSVSDQGKGMSEQEATAAFGEFVQGDSSDTRLYGGLGLGLSLVQRVVEGHGGSVAWESYPGRGSKFSLLLPITARQDAPLEASG
jgi:two-component system phosphate regulon sensor histidine kinase PhoR